MGKNALHTEDVKLLIENLWDAIYVVDEERNITHWNAAAEATTGYTREEVLGRSCGNELLAHHCDSTFLCNVACPLDHTRKDGAIRAAQVSLRHKNGLSIPVFVRTIPYRNAEGIIAGVIEIFRKVDGADEASPLLNDLEQKAYVEPLTKTARRDYGERMLNNAIAAFHSQRTPFGVLLIDLDHFKRVNDTKGHQAGDAVLQHISKLIQSNLRSADLLVRWGGDEFLVISPTEDAQSLAHLGDKLCHLARNDIIRHENERFVVTLSIGGATPVFGDTAESLMKRADENLYASKNKNRDCSTVA